jgi:hypothetical protein
LPNSGSDTIAVFHIGENGALPPVEGFPFPSGGNDPVSLGLSGNTLFVVNKSGLIQQFQFDGNGGLDPLTPLALPASEFS